MFLRPTPHPQRFQGPSCVIMWVLGPQSPWRREHCSALGTWGVLFLLLSPPPWLILVPSCSLSSTNWFTSSPSSSLSVSSLPSSLESHFPPLEQGSLQSQTPLAHSHY
ncbi:unnamed protein product [Microthlaspi erraticum]|uniref:Uncharacterized protein n=1 Tax=Microthlaspi erraticum TaxID=1685480 RepID=A0A6D2KRC3_9BRAS|nr:unnamed protein product [Microthlaspi erraticum]